jgi:DNA-binding transcriptional regulator YdaS (Cro superfamily)
MSNPVDHLNTAIAIAGNQSALARLMHKKSGYRVTQQAISVWIKTGTIPPKAVPAICRAVDNQVSAADLCPDLFAV